MINPRANTLGLLFHHDCILVEEQYGRHSRGEGVFYRPIGGTIELGEKSSEALIREYNEELNVLINIVKYITCLENIYRIDEQIGHEITQIYEVEFVESQLYQQNIFQVTEGEKITVAKWVNISEFTENRRILYPNGLRELLNNI